MARTTYHVFCIPTESMSGSTVNAGLPDEGLMDTVQASSAYEAAKAVHAKHFEKDETAKLWVFSGTPTVVEARATQTVVFAIAPSAPTPKPTPKARTRAQDYRGEPHS